MQNEELLTKFFEKSIVALAKIISIIENRANGYEDVLARIFPRSRNGYRIGITGPPGSGKSTIVDKVAMHLARNNKEIGIVAIDPSSPFTGGAVLGDRIRMKGLITLENVFIRSMATRGSLGGLAAATKDVLIALDSFGKEHILIETVGVGQIELDVVNACDTVIVVLTPEAGDSIQAMKAGLIEIANIFVVNKADREGAEMFANELQSIIKMKEDSQAGADVPSWEVPVIPTVAIENEGIEELIVKVTEYQEFITKQGIFEAHRKAQIKHRIHNIIEQKIRKFAEDRFLNEMNIETVTQEVFEGKVDPYSAVKEYFSIDHLDKLG